VHLSDLHLTRTDGRPRSEPDLLSPLKGMNQTFRRLLATQQLQNADLILVTGDITDRGDTASWQVFNEATTRAGVADRLLLVPGNHDVCCLGTRLPGRRNAYRTDDLRRATRGLSMGMAESSQMLEGGWPVTRFPIVAHPDPRVVVFGLNSNFLGNLNIASNALGKVDYFQLVALAGKMHRFRNVPVKIVALHHSPNIPYTATARRRGTRPLTALARAGHQIPRGQRRAIRLLCITHRVRLLLHGHLHQADDRRISGLRIVGAPASTQPVQRRADGADVQIFTYTVSAQANRVRTRLTTITLN